MFEEQTPSDEARFKNRIRSSRSKHFDLFILAFYARIRFSRRKGAIRMSDSPTDIENEVKSLIHTPRSLESVYWQLNCLESRVCAWR